MMAAVVAVMVAAMVAVVAPAMKRCGDEAAATVTSCGRQRDAQSG